MRKFKNLSKGFTLLELMIAIAITSILFTIGYVNFQDFSRREALITAARSLKDDVKLAQESAITGVKPVDSGSFVCGTFQGYRFRVVNTTRYTLEAVCSGGFQTMKTVDLATGIFTISSTVNPFLFKTLAQGTDITSGTTAIVTLTQTSTGNTSSISIGAGGNVE